MARRLAAALAWFCLCTPSAALAQDPAKAPAPSGAPEASPNAPDASQSDAPEPPQSAQTNAPVTLVPPRVLESPPPRYPESHLSHAEHPTVVLKVTVLSDGSVADVAVEHSAGEDFDAAAIAAVRSWRFEPARRGDEPIASRVGVAVHFDLPELGVLEVGSVTGAERVVPHPHEEPLPDQAQTALPEPVFEAGAKAEVRAPMRRAERSASDYQLSQATLRAAPRRDAADMLEAAPGIVATRIEGEAVGHRLMLRGFDADHGQDIELKLGGVPINQPSHIHGQGYAELGFIIPETVRGLRVLEGVYDPAQGDFAVAGSADFDLGVAERGVMLSSSYGSFDTFRQLALWAPERQREETFAAVAFRRTRGFGQNRAGESASAIAQALLGSGPFRVLLHGSAYATRAETANVVRRDDVDSGRIGFYDVYPYATASAQHAASTRAQLSANARYHGEEGDNAELQLAYVFNDFRLAANYTGFAELPPASPSVLSPGDLLDQINQDQMLFARARYRSQRYTPYDWFQGTYELGFTGRVDRIDQRMSFVNAPVTTVWERRIDAGIVTSDIGSYADLDLELTKYVRASGGLRADFLSYRLDNHLPPAGVPSSTETRTAAAIVLAPRTVLEVLPVEPLSLSIGYGEGFRSPQALLIGTSGKLDYTRVRSLDLGIKGHFGPERVLTLGLTGYYTHVSSDLVFEADEGRPEAVGPSTRLGTVLTGQLDLFHGIVVNASATYVHAQLDQRPRAEGGEQPTQKIPYVPPWVVRLDVSGTRDLLDVQGAALRGHASGGFTYWAPRPFATSGSSPSVTLFDAELGVAFRFVDLSISAFNLLDARYAALEVVYASNWDPSAAAASASDARHIMAGAPRTFLGTLGLTF